MEINKGPKAEFILTLIILVSWDIQVGSEHFTYPEISKNYSSFVFKGVRAESSKSNLPEHQISHNFPLCRTDKGRVICVCGIYPIFPPTAPITWAKLPRVQCTPETVTLRNTAKQSQGSTYLAYACLSVVLTSHAKHFCRNRSNQLHSKQYSRVCYNELSYNERMLQRPVFINKIKMLQRRRRSTIVSFLLCFFFMHGINFMWWY